MSGYQRIQRHTPPPESGQGYQEEDTGSAHNRSYNQFTEDGISFSNDISDETSQLLSTGHAHNLNENQTAGSSWYASVFLVVNAALGAGLLNFPAAYDESGGIWVAIGVQAVLMVFVLVAMAILLYCSDVYQTATYPDVVRSMCGRKMQTFCAATVALYCFGTCITFFIIIGDQWDKFLSHVHGPDFCHYWYLNRDFTMVITSILLVLPMCFAKRIDFLKYVSFVGVIIVVYIVAMVTVKYFVGPIHPSPIKTKPTHWSDVFLVVPVICFAYQCHLSIVPIYSCMKRRTLKEFSKTLSVAMAICIFSYTGTASFGYLTFGSRVDQDVLKSYDPVSPDVLVAIIGLALKMYTTYPILLFVGRSAMENVFLYFWIVPPDVIARGELKRRIIMTTVWFVLTLFLAVLVPNIGVVIALLGGLAAVFVFIFPGLCLMQLVRQNHITRQDSAKYYAAMSFAVFFIVFGMFIFGVITTQAVMTDVLGSAQPSHESPLCL